MEETINGAQAAGPCGSRQRRRRRHPGQVPYPCLRTIAGKALADRVLPLLRFTDVVPEDADPGGRAPFRCSRDVAEAMRAEMDTSGPGAVTAVLLDGDNRRIGILRLPGGGAGTALPESGHLIRAALVQGARAMVLLHTHPSGDPMPGAADVRATADLYKNARLAGVSLVDHLVMTPTGWYSFAENAAYRFG